MIVSLCEAVESVLFQNTLRCQRRDEHPRVGLDAANAAVGSGWGYSLHWSLFSTLFIIFHNTVGDSGGRSEDPLPC